MIDPAETQTPTLGKPIYPSPVSYAEFGLEEDRVVYNVSLETFKKYCADQKEPFSFERAGPREQLFFNPKLATSAIVTCGGICPGLNNVIRALVMQLYYVYGVRNILGIPYGFQGFISKYGHEPIPLDPNRVAFIDELGGTILGTSRGNQNISEIVDSLERLNVKILFAIGGDGTLRASQSIYEEISRRGLKIGVIGIPKTIDNDISFVSKSFGFETAFSAAVEAVRSAHVEAQGAPHGIGLVKLMGRQSGFIAANAALALKEVNFVLIPEVDFDLEGPAGLLNQLEERLRKRQHAVIVVAEGAGQRYLEDSSKMDLSGNVVLGEIGLFLKDMIKSYFRIKDSPIALKYIDPSYIIRSVPANPNDSIFCGFLAQNAVHAGMAGKTGMVIGIWNNVFIHVPIRLTISQRKVVRADSNLWLSVLESTGQRSLKNE